MVPELTALKQPIAIRPEHVASQPTKLRIKPHSKSISGADFTISQDAVDTADVSPKAAEAATLFSVDGKVMSWTQKRTFRDASGLPLFDLYRKKTGVTWFVELPGGDDTALVKLEPRWSAFKDKFDVHVKNVAASSGEEVKLEVRGQDIWKLRTNVYFGDKVVATAKRLNKMDVCKPSKGPEWGVDVAEGMDTSLVAAIVVVMAAIMYDSNPVSTGLNR